MSERTQIARATTATSWRIVVVRGINVLLDRDVAELFDVEVRKLNQQVKRNAENFGDEFVFRLTWDEFNELRSQNVTLAEWSKVTYPPVAFTEYGIVMVATLLKSAKAIEATKLIVRTFVDARREAWERELAKARGGQLPLALDTPTRQGLVTKLNMTLGHVLDAIVDPDENRTVRDEAREVAAEGIRSVKEYMKRVGIGNEKSLAEVRRIMAEAEAIEVETSRKRTENQHRQLALLAKKLKLVIQAQLYAETGSVDGLLVVLSDLEKS
ncbi:MAG: ORF6N domain-containing protein [Hyphomicrobiaceae bacterium]|nr:ORF6N domain-containing protein [Hyphomicrobiaceae bacterium]